MWAEVHTKIKSLELKTILFVSEFSIDQKPGVCVLLDGRNLFLAVSEKETLHKTFDQTKLIVLVNIFHAPK